MAITVTAQTPIGPTAHVIFELKVGSDGWPPVGAERIWAYDLGSDRYRIDNVPWFVNNLAVDDVVRAVAPDSDSHPVFTELLEPSDHLTVRIVCLRGGPLHGDLQPVIDAFTPLGVYAEGIPQYGMVALDIPATTNPELVYARLQAGVEAGSWDYDEGRISPAWTSLTHSAVRAANEDHSS